jgi:hypothetical protein
VTSTQPHQGLKVWCAHSIFVFAPIYRPRFVGAVRKNFHTAR